MKKFTKSLWKKTKSFFSKETLYKINSFYKKNQKHLLLSLVVFLVPLTSFALGWDTVYNGMLNFALTITNVFKALASIIIYSAGVLFDNMLLITLSVDMYDADWVKLGWSLIRDVANIAFILAVVIIGIFMIIGRTQWKKMLINLIIIVFIMNFSMFFARVIIDAGNFTAAIFYSMSSVKVSDSDKVEDAAGTISFNVLEDRLVFAKAVLGKKDEISNKQWEPYFGNRSIATGLVAFVNPTGMYRTKDFEKKLRDKGKKEDEIKTTLIILNIIFILTMVFLSSALIKASFMFISRTIHLIKWIIAAPIYFAWYFLPGGGGKLYEWFGEIANKAFCVTSYMVGMWLIFLFLSSDVSKLIDMINNEGVIAIVSIVIVKSFLIFKALELLTEMGTKHCNDGKTYGEGLANFASSAAGFLGGGFVKTGATIFTRGGVGYAASRIQKSSFVKKMVKSDNVFARVGGEKLYSGLTKVRNIKIGGKTFDEQVEKNNKNSADIDAGLSEQERKERYAARTPGGKKKKKFTSETVQKQYDNADGQNLRNKELKDLNEITSVLKKRGVPKKEINEIYNKEKNKIDEKYKSGEYEKQEKVDIANKNAHLIQETNIAGKALGAVLGEKGEAMGNSFGSVSSFLIRGATGTLDEKESDRQYHEKKKLEAEIGAKKEHEKIIQKDTSKKTSEDKLTLSKAEKDLKNGKIEEYLKKMVRLWDVNRDGKLDISEALQKRIMNNENIDTHEFSEILTALKKADKNGLNKELDSIKFDDLNSYIDSRDKKGEAEEELRLLESKLRAAENSGDEKAVDDAFKEVEEQKGKIKGLEKEMKKVVDAFENVTVRQKEVVEQYGKDIIDASKKRAERYTQEEKEIAENIGKGAPVHHGVNERSTIPNVDAS